MSGSYTPAGAVWDERYRGSEYAFGIEPNAWLAEQAGRFSPGSRVFVPGDGEGRNGAWLARLGHRVVSLDLSVVGVEKALALAARQGLSIEARQGDLAACDWEQNGFDAVASIFLHLEPDIRPRVHAAFAAALKPGGLLIIEGFAPAQLDLESGGPRREDMLFTPEMLQADFGTMLQPVILEEAPTELLEGPRHQGRAFVTRGVFRKVGDGR